MANLNGEVQLQALGRSWTLRLDIDELIEAEAATGKSVIEMASNMGLGSLIALLHAGLRPHHPEVDRAKAVEIFKGSDFTAVSTAIAQAMQAAFPESKGAGSAAGGPPKARPKGKRR